MRHRRYAARPSTVNAQPASYSRIMQSGVELADAREALAYWEARARQLPRRAVRRRREAAQMARRWRDRVVCAERAQYGAGLRGALQLLLAEGRLPAAARHTGHR